MDTEPDAAPALLSLRDVADRVGREVDTFAETLDKFNEDLRGEDAWTAAHSLCLAYKDNGEDMVKQLRKKWHLAQMTAARDHRGTHKTTEEDEGFSELKRWEAERDTWDLFRIMLEVRYGSLTEQAVKQGHAYETTDEALDRFLVSDTRAKEQFAVLKWLEESAADADKDTPDGERFKGSAVKTNGWIGTREAIKGAKRMRFTDNETLEVRSANGEPLVSELDPDAPSRQERALEKADAVSEREVWLACWNMLRRGTPWHEIAKWCADKQQSWRAVSLGVATDSEGPMRGGGPTNGVLWRHMCLLAARSAAVDESEAAVYGLLGGDLDTVSRLCRTWADHVYAHFNHVFIQRYNSFLLKHETYRLPTTFIKNNGLAPIPQDQDKDTLRKLFQRLTSGLHTGSEALMPINQLQTALLQDTTIDLSLQVGVAANDATNGHAPQVSSAAAALASHADALRILTHALIMLNRISPSASTPQAVDATDSIIAAYIQLIREAGKRDLAPIYASMMTPARGVTSLAQVISDIQDGKESMEFVKLMEIYSIDAIGVLKGQCQYLLGKVADTPPPPPFSMLEDTRDELNPGRRVKLDTLDVDITEAEEALIRSLEAFYSIQGHWVTTFEALAHVCRKLLLHGRVATACLLVERIQYDQMSNAKSQAVLGHSINVMDESKIAVYATDESKLMQVEVLQETSRAYYGLSLLVQAIGALVDWRHVEHEFARYD